MTMKLPDSILGQFGETTRCRDVQHGDGFVVLVDTAVRQWCTRLRASVEVKGGHFEHKLSQQLRMLWLHITA